MKERVGSLYEKVNRVGGKGRNEGLKDGCDGWISGGEGWEKSEGLLFGGYEIDVRFRLEEGVGKVWGYGRVDLGGYLFGSKGVGEEEDEFGE